MAINGNLKVLQPNRLLSSAQGYRALGYSLIPTNAKIAAVPWKIYQSARATDQQLRQWLRPEGGQDGYTGLAIVTGPVSQLAVLDFDNRSLYRQFCRQYRQLAATYTVQTRRGYHLYYRAPPSIQLASRCVPGVDLQYQGKYVVAPPSVIDGHTYQTTQGGLPRALTQADWATINYFLDAQRFGPAAAVQQPASETRVGPDPEPAPARSPQPSSLSGHDLAALYRVIAPRDGRNATLFKLSCLGRDNGLSQAQVVTALAHYHAAQPPSGDQRPESNSKRYREAERTIASAFSRQPRSGQHRYQDPEQLPNRVREALCQNKLTGAVRVIEGLRLKGIPVGRQFTKKQAVALLAGIVGRDSVYNALNAVLEDERPLFKRDKSPLSTPLTPTAVAEVTVPGHPSKCLELKLPKPGIVSHPRSQPLLFTMPGNRELAQKLGVEQATISDALSLEDLKSAKTTRTALHSGLLKRRAGQYSVAFFATRLGLSKRTIYRYNRADQNIHAAPIYLDQAVFWTNLEALIPPDPSYFPHDGVFLEDGQGRKYPPKPAIARKLLAAKQPVTLRTRQANYWWYGAATMPLAQLVDYQALQERLDHKAARRRQPPHYEFPVLSPERAARIAPVASETPLPGPGANAHPVSARQPGRQTSDRQPLPDPAAEAFAQQVHKTINALSSGKQGNISLAAARRLVQRYGERAVRRALTTTAKRRNVRKPIGFISTILRSEARSG